MTPERLRELAERADPEQLWRRGGLDLTPEQRAQLDTGIALRRYAAHLEQLRAARIAARSVLITPLSENGSALRTVETPPDHARLRM